MRSALLLPVLLLPALAHAQAPPLTLESPNPEQTGRFGWSVSGVADANGDGRGDLLVGASSASAGGHSNAGRAYLFSGTTGALLRTLTSPNPEFSGEFGVSVSGVPDVNGDGRGDLLVGAHDEDDGAGDAGRVYLFSGATGALLRTLQSPNPEFFGLFGYSVSGVADADGDGRSDLLIGAAYENGGAVSAGRAYLFSGATGALLHTLNSPNPETEGRFGTSVSGVPDADGDGRGDLLVGAYEEGGRAQAAGRAYLFSGTTGALLRMLQSPDAAEHGFFGGSVSGVPDANGDGAGDLLVGALFHVNDVGRAYLFSGATGALLRTLASPNPDFLGYFGGSVSGVADVDGDHRGDLLVGAHGESVGVYQNGRAYLFSGATGALLRTLGSPNPERLGYFGVVVGGVPDTDGDSRGDLLISAVFEDGGAPDAGRAYLFSGVPTVSSEPGPEDPSLNLTVAPNPARDRAAFTLSFPYAGPARLSVHDVLGREVAVLVDGAVPAGAHTAAFDARGLASGVYVWRLISGESVQTGQLTLLE